MAYTSKKASSASDAEFNRFRRDIERGDFANLYIFGGAESYLLNQYVRNISERIVGENDRDFNLLTLSGGTANPTAISDAVETPPMFAPRKCVILRDFDLLNPPATHKKFAAELIDTIPDYICLICILDGDIAAAKDKKIAEAIKNRARVISFQRQGDRELEQWIAQRFEAAGVSCSAKSAAFLLRRTEGFMQGLSVEIDKIAAYCAGRGVVTDADITLLNVPCIEAVIYELTDAMSTGNAARALTLSGQLISQKQEPLSIINALSRALRQIYAAKMLEGRQNAQFALMQALNIRSAYAAGKVADNARRAPADRLRKGVMLCAKADYDQKRSPCDRRVMMENTIFELCNMFR